MPAVVGRWLAGWVCILAAGPAVAAQAPATDVLLVRQMGPGLARDIVDAAVANCRDKGYQVTAVVVDRDGIVQALLRDVYASRFTLQIAEQKANATILSGLPSAQFRANRGDIRAEMNHVDGVLMLEGGVPIEAAGSLLGAVGVSGAPGGDQDALCAQAGVDAVRERLQFVE